jgi:proline iminopeptidase
MKKHIVLFVLLFPLFIAVAQEMRITTSDSVSLFVTVKGKGTPCLYIHGGPASGSYWIEKFNGEFLEQHFQMIYLDQRGCCRSTSPKDHNYSMDRMVKDFEEVRQVLGIKQWLTMGHSFGGMLQMGYAQRHPEAIDGMMMINCTLNWKESFDRGFRPKACEVLNITDTAAYTDESVLFLDRFGALIQKLNEKGLMWKLGYASKKNYDIMSATFREVPKWTHGSEEYIVYTKDYREDFKQSTSAMSMPVLFFYGKNDWSVGPEHYRGVNFPAMLLWGSDVGHMPFLEAKVDLKKAIVTYLATYKFE